ncbi:AlpA family transcriptional regulator [Shewanella mangrovisoli]|uniref:AlpA family transcriptional regulator n=1 Tax=Shewanella mangrovisoli TaxID=2864211 RepID=A0ABV4VDM8_9GAMM
MKLIKLKEVIEITCLTKATIYRMIKEGTFPKQLSLGDRAVAWVEKEVFNWVEERIAARDECK